MTGHCFDCGREWSGNAEAHCLTCCEHFSSDDAFDAHLANPQADENCYPPATLTKKDDKTPRFIQIERVHGPVWILNRPDLIAKETALSDLRASPDSTNGPRGDGRKQTPEIHEPVATSGGTS